MRLTAYTDYSLRLLMFVAVKGERLSTIEEVSKAYGISHNHLMKVAHRLGQEGFLETVRGRKGGLRLGRAPERISLGQVVRTMEEDMDLVECFAVAQGGCVISGPCRLNGVLREALRAFLTVLDGYTLADLVARPASLSKLLLAG
jgi:Rrf2 family nitric oxide-sensitive transcriptional repressor